MPIFLAKIGGVLYYVICISVSSDRNRKVYILTFIVIKEDRRFGMNLSQYEMQLKNGQ